MNFSGLVAAVQQFWDFFWPAAVCLAVLLGVAYGVAPVASFRIAAWVKRLKPTAAAQNSAYKTFKRLGFDKLLPVVAAFCVLFVMDVAKTMVVEVGEATPPYVSYRYDLWFLHRFADERLVCLWAHFDDKPALVNFEVDIDRASSEIQAQNKDSQVFSNLETWQRAAGHAEGGFSAAKFFLLLALLAGLIEIIVTRRFTRPLLSALVSCSLFATVATFFLFRHVWAIEQEQDARLTAIETYLFEKPPDCRLLSQESKAAFQKAIEDSWAEAKRYGENRWWTLRFYDSYYPHWIWRQVFTPADDLGAISGFSSDRIRDQRMTSGGVEETRETVAFYLAEASANRLYVAEGNSQPPKSGQRETATGPAQTASVVNATVTSSSLPRYTGKQILWVDDHPENNAYEVKLFKALGIRVLQVRSTAAALESLSESKYDIVISDMLRGSDNHAGYELLNAMHQRQIEIPTFIYSASSNDAFRAQAIASGAKGETNNPTELLQLVTTALLGSQDAIK